MLNIEEKILDKVFPLTSLYHDEIQYYLDMLYK